MLCSIYSFILHQQKVKQFTSEVKDFSADSKDFSSDVKDYSLDAEVRSYSEKDLSDHSDDKSFADKSFADKEDSIDMEDVSGRLLGAEEDRMEDRFTNLWDEKVINNFEGRFFFFQSIFFACLSLFSLFSLLSLNPSLSFSLYIKKERKRKNFFSFRIRSSVHLPPDQ